MGYSFFSVLHYIFIHFNFFLWRKFLRRFFIFKSVVCFQCLVVFLKESSKFLSSSFYKFLDAKNSQGWNPLGFFTFYTEKNYFTKYFHASRLCSLLRNFMLENFQFCDFI